FVMRRFTDPELRVRRYLPAAMISRFLAKGARNMECPVILAHCMTARGIPALAAGQQYKRWLGCLKWVNNGPDSAETGLPKCPREQRFAVLVGRSQTCQPRIFSAPVGMSQRCQKRTLLRSNTSGMSVKGVLTTQPQPSVRQPS